MPDDASLGREEIETSGELERTVECTDALVQTAIGRLSRRYPEQAIGGATLEDLRQMRPQLEGAMAALSHFHRPPSSSVDASVDRLPLPQFLTKVKWQWSSWNVNGLFPNGSNSLVRRSHMARRQMHHSINGGFGSVNTKSKTRCPRSKPIGSLRPPGPQTSKESSSRPSPSGWSTYVFI
jgi:hypothetical protein